MDTHVRGVCAPMQGVWIVELTTSLCPLMPNNAILLFVQRPLVSFHASTNAFAHPLKLHKLLDVIQNCRILCSNEVLAHHFVNILSINGHLVISAYVLESGRVVRRSVGSRGSMFSSLLHNILIWRLSLFSSQRCSRVVPQWESYLKQVSKIFS